MRLTFSTVLLLCAHLLVSQITSFPHTQSFEQVFITGTDVSFIANWQGNEVATTNRIFQGNDGRTGTHSLNVIPTSSFSSELLISLDMSAELGGKLSFYAYSKANGATSTRPTLLYFSTSIDGGNTYLDNVQIGDENTFPNNNSTNYTRYAYEMPGAVAGQNQVLIKIDVIRGDGSGSAAELVLDDFLIEEALPALAVSSMSYLSSNEIQLQFNQPVEKISAETLTNYLLNYGFESPTSAVQDGANPSIVRLTFSKAFVNNTYELTINNVQNADASSVASDLKVNAKNAARTFSRQLVINEIYADPIGANAPSPTVLPTATTAEYIELYNPTSEAIEISDFDLSGGTIGNFTLPANEHVILTASGNVATYQAFGNTVAVSSWNTLSNAGERITLSDQLGNVVDSLSFNTTWYSDDDKADGGWALEQINPTLVCSGKTNWNASNANAGGTPGSQNSRYNNAPDVTGPRLDSVIINSPTQITLVFNELMDAASVNAATYTLSDGISVASASSTPSLLSVALTLCSPMQSGTNYILNVTGVTDCAGNANTQSSITFLFDNEPPALTRFVFKNDRLVDLIFDEPVALASAEAETNYVVNNGIGQPTSAQLNNTNSARVSLNLANPLSLGSDYQVTLNNLQDSLSNAIVNQTENFTFVNDLDTLIVISSQLLDIYFKEDVNVQSTALSNYQVQDLGNPVSATIDNANAKLIHLSFDGIFPENRSREISFEHIQNSANNYLQVLNSSFVYDTDDPDLINSDVIDANQLRLDFDEILDETSAEIINHYSVNNGIGLPATANLTNGDSSVILSFTQGFTQEVQNRISYTGIEDLSGNNISTNRTLDFTFDTRPPRFDSLIVYSPRALLLSFTEEVVQSVAEDVSNYSVNNGIGNPIESLRLDSATSKVLLTFGGLGNNQTNILTISNQRDQFANDFDQDITVEFSSLIPGFGNFQILSDTSLQLQFTKDIQQSSAEEVENYGFDNGVGLFAVEQNATDPSIVKIILTTRLKEETNYRLVVDSLEDVFGNFIAPTAYDFTFNDRLNSLEILSSNSIRLTFDVALLEAAAETTSNYSISAIGTQTSAVLNPANANQVTLTLPTNLIESSSYTMSISGLSNTFGGGLAHFSTDFLYDISPPVVTAVNSVYGNEIEVVFNEKLDPVSGLALNHYSIDNGIGTPTKVSFSNTDQSAVLLTLTSPLVDGQAYVLTVDRVADTQGKAMNANAINFTFQALAEPSFRQIVINEVYFDVDPKSGLPPHEFIELLNLNNTAFQLRDFKLTDGNDTAIFKTHTILNGEHLVLSSGIGANALNGLALTRFPSLANNGETIYLIDRKNNIIDSLAFNKRLYNDETKSSGGYSIELINPAKPCFDPGNYAASTAPQGGTPGNQNTLFDASPDANAPQLAEVIVTSTTAIQLAFNEGMDISSLTQANFSLQSGIRVNQVLIKDPFGQQIELLLESGFQRGTTQTLIINGVQDCSGNTLNTQTEFELGALPSVNDLLITEIMATPTPEVGLPPLEYVELYNNTSTILALNDVYLADNAGRTRIGDINIAPNAYLILTKNSAVARLNSYGDVQGINSFPTYTIQDEVRLEHADSSIIFSVSYDRSFYKDAAKANGGYSMEMIRLNPACQSPDNWRASEAGIGGTPGQQNSVFTAAPDTEAPTVIDFNVLSDTTFSLRFSEAMDIASFTANHIEFNPNLSVEHITATSPFGYQLTIEIDGPFSYGEIYALTLNGFRDCAGNALNTPSFEFVRGRTPQSYELIITELMVNPSPSVGLPESEYIEIYNTSQDVLSLNNVVLADAVNSTTLPDTVIYPGAYLLLTPNSTADAFGTNTLGLFNWPNLNQEKETVQLFNAENSLLFSLRYTDSWYRSSLKAQGGYSLEMIDLSYPCVESGNWSASESNNGGTPGQVNSINGNNPDNQGPQLLQAVMLDAGTIQLRFSERLAPVSIDETDFEIDNGLDFIAFGLDETERVVTLYTSNDLVNNQVYTISVDNLTDCSGNLISSLHNSAQLIVPSAAEVGDILINEVLFNPRSGGARFVECYNHSSKYINLKDWRISGLNNNRLISEEDLIIAPNSYFGLTNDVVNIQSEYPAAVANVFVELSSMPSMRDDNGAIIILDQEGLAIDRFDYDESYHSPLLDDNEGVSLERLRFNGDSNDENNWFSASAANNYATPGFANSQALMGEARNDIVIVEPLSFSPDISGTADFTTLTYNFDSPGNVLNINIFDANGNLIRRLSQNKLVGTTTFFTWDGTNDDGARARIGYYMILTEVINAEGRVVYLKDKVAIGGRF